MNDRAPAETIGAVMADAAATHGTRAAAFGSDGTGTWRTLTFAELDDCARRVGGLLAARTQSLNQSAAIAWSYGNDNALVALVLHLGIASAGYVSVPINPAATHDEAAEVVHRTGAAAVIRPRESTDGADAEIGVLRCDGFAELRSLIEHVPRAGYAHVDPAAPAIVLFTSGTTGRSKGVVHSHATALAAARGWADAFELTDRDTYQSMFPVYAGSGLHFGALACLAAGAANVVDVPRPTTSCLARIGEFRSTVYAAVPSIYQYWLAENLGEYDLTSLRLLDFGGSVMPKTTIEALRAAVPTAHLMQTYGLTEAGPGGLYLRPEDLDRKLGAVGSIGSGDLRFRVNAAAATDDEAAGDGVVGELEFAGSSVMLGYLDDPDATAGVYRDGWLRTGDLVRVDDDGFVYFLDRLKDLIVRGGFNISSVEVEEALAGYPGVDRIAAFGVPHDDLGEVVGVAIVPDDRAAFNFADFHSYAAQHLSRVKVPAWAVLVDELPLSAAGKVLKTALRRHPDLAPLPPIAP